MSSSSLMATQSSPLHRGSAEYSCTQVPRFRTPLGLSASCQYLGGLIFLTPAWLPMSLQARSEGPCRCCPTVQQRPSYRLPCYNLGVRADLLTPALLPMPRQVRSEGFCGCSSGVERPK